MSDTANSRILNAAAVVSALGYFADVFDLLLFGVVRVKSLTSQGLKFQVGNPNVYVPNVKIYVAGPKILDREPKRLRPERKNLRGRA